MYYGTSSGNPQFLNTRVRDLETGEDTLIHEGSKGPTYLGEVSEDEKSFILIQIFANTYNNAFVKQGEAEQSYSRSRKGSYGDRRLICK